MCDDICDDDNLIFFPKKTAAHLLLRRTRNFREFISRPYTKNTKTNYSPSPLPTTHTLTLTSLKKRKKIENAEAVYFTHHKESTVILYAHFYDVFWILKNVIVVFSHKGLRKRFFYVIEFLEKLREIFFRSFSPND